MTNAPFKTVLGTAFIILAFIPIYYFLVFPDFGKFTPEGFGQFGDYFGGVLNPLFSFLAIFLLVFSLKQQSDVIGQQSIIIKQQEESIKIQSEELKDSNEQLKLSREEMKSANVIHSEQLKIQSRDVVKKAVEEHCNNMLRELSGAYENISSFRMVNITRSYSLSRVCRALKDEIQGLSEFREGENADALYFHNNNKEIARKHLEKFEQSLKVYFSAVLANVEFIDASVIMDLQDFNIKKYLEAALLLNVISKEKALAFEKAYTEEKRRRNINENFFHNSSFKLTDF